jgi:hypothetical protein
MEESGSGSSEIISSLWRFLWTWTTGILAGNDFLVLEDLCCHCFFLFRIHLFKKNIKKEYQQ